jgi:thiol-disulfide isomerase/thioredoxin
VSFQPTAPPPRSRAPLIIGIVVAVVVIAAAVVVFTRGGSDDDVETSSSLGLSAPPTQAPTASTIPPSSLPPITNGGPSVATAPVTVTGAAVAALPNSGADPAAGALFPDLRGLKVTDSSPLAITNDGRPKVIIFLAHWCPHCQREVPLLTQWIAQNGMPPTVDLYAVSTGVVANRGNFPPADWIIKEQFPVPTLADDPKNTAFNAAGLTTFPSFVAVGADGTLKRRATGELSIEQFQTLLANAVS